MPFCSFGREIKKKLVDIDQTQDWLIEQVKADTGLYFDSGYLHRILRGECNPQRIISSICKILELEFEPNISKKVQTALHKKGATR